MMRAMKIKVIGVALDLGAEFRGAALGPAAARAAGLVSHLQALGHEVRDAGDVHTVPPSPDDRVSLNSKCRFKNEVVSVCRRLHHAVSMALQEGYFPLVIGGDHSLAMGSASAVSQFFEHQNLQTGLIWFDAHGDINTPESSLTGNIHGMPVAHLLGLGDSDLNLMRGRLSGFRAENTVLIGPRDLDDGERKIITELGVHVFTAEDIQRMGIATVISQAHKLASKNANGYHVSFDMDWLDPAVAPGVGTPVVAGANRAQALVALQLIAKWGWMRSLDIVELNPLFDDANITARLAVEFASAALPRIESRDKPFLTQERRSASKEQSR